MKIPSSLSKPQLVEQINSCLHSGDYSRALDLLRGAEFPSHNDAEMSELEKLARDGVKRNAEAQRLITESQELFAQQKSAEAIQLLRQAYELDRTNSLARAILANALVEQAHSIVETDWLEAEALTNQALKLNPAHPTAKTIRSLIVDQKKASSVEDWVCASAQATVFQRSVRSLGVGCRGISGSSRQSQVASDSRCDPARPGRSAAPGPPRRLGRPAAHGACNR